MLVTAFTQDDLLSQRSYRTTTRSIFPTYTGSGTIRASSMNRKVALINEVELFKLCAIN